MKKLLVVCFAVGLFFSCDGPSSDQGAASGGGSDNAQPSETQRPRTPAPEEDGSTGVSGDGDTVATAPPPGATTAGPTTVSESSEATDSVPFPEITGRSDALFYGNDYNGPYRIYLRYEDYLGRDDIPSVYMGVAVQDSGSYSSSFTSAVFRYLVNEYDFVLLSIYDDRTGEYLGPSTYARSRKVADAYEDFLHEHAGEFAQAPEDQTPRGIELSEEDFKDLVISSYEYTSYHVQTFYLAPDVPPWTYSDGNVEVLGDAPGQASRSSAPPEPTTVSPEPTPPEATTSGSSSPANPEAEVQEAAEEYYRAAGVEDWSYTYENLDEETQSGFTEEEWFEKNEWLAENGEVIYSVGSVYQVGTSTEYLGVTLTLTYEDGTSSTRETFFIYEDGGWKHRFGEEENDLFMPDATFEEFVEAQS